jgi:hypothetical protein
MLFLLLGSLRLPKLMPTIAAKVSPIAKNDSDIKAISLGNSEMQIIEETKR